ncbi:FACT complex subunit Ssrp1 isoform X2 [Neocloeon triangulifer]|uniref:FACT complex subunit Ssrp1 isoform X2 n=1 Tax=Neocloeon triangulifer TaxID=2078957 RepID=UPI00286F2C86|nr:FACT complex subunit Ssrp1 isoform X2 [Neocloeon triangulifer]
MDFLEYAEIQTEIKGAITPGKLKLTDQHIIFKNSKTGKVEQINGSDVDAANWQKHVGCWGIRLFMKNGNLHRFIGFKEQDQDKLAKFFKKNYEKDMLEKELSLKGWNWGTAKFLGSQLSFDVGSLTAFEIPLNNVSQCTTGKNEVTLEYHQNDDAAVGLLEMRFHIPSSELAGDDPVEQFQQNVMNKASVISAVGDAVAIFREIQCLTPRGRYDIKVFPSFFQLHGKTFDYKIPMSTVLRLFILPHKDGRQMFFVASLDPPIKQGQTRYHFLVFSFGPDEETSIELPMSEKELEEKYEGKLSKELTGSTCEVLSRVMKCMTGRKITMPNTFVGHSGTPAVGCSYKAAAGYLYPLERGFIYVHKPPVHIRFEEIMNVNFARSGGSTRSFDFEIELKSGIVHTFSSIEKDEYTKLFDFIQNKKLHIKNKGKTDKPSYADDFGDSDQEDAPDAYLARVKREAKERDQGDDDEGSEDESEDEDFKPPEETSDVAEEFDSNVSSSESDDSDASEGTKEKKRKEKERKKEKKATKAKSVSEKPRKKKKEKKEDDGKPKRPLSAYMIWINDNRESIKKKYPGISMTDVAKKGGELWRELKDKSEWEEKAAKLKAEYEVAMKEYNASGGSGGGGSSKKSSGGGSSSKTSSKVVVSPTKSGSGTNYKSKEYLSDDDDSSDEDSSKKKQSKSAPKPASKKSKKDASSEEEKSEEDEEDDKKKRKKSPKKDSPKKKSKKKDSDEDEEVEDEEEILSSPTASSESGDDSD